MTTEDVVLEVALLRKGCIAEKTEKGTPSCVDAQVLLEVAVMSEGSRTQAALEGTLARVSAKVCVHVCSLLGHIGTLPAIMQFILY